MILTIQTAVGASGTFQRELRTLLAGWTRGLEHNASSLSAGRLWRTLLLATARVEFRQVLESEMFPFSTPSLVVEDRCTLSVHQISW